MCRRPARGVVVLAVLAVAVAAPVPALATLQWSTTCRRVCTWSSSTGGFHCLTAPGSSCSPSKGFTEGAACQRIGSCALFSVCPPSVPGGSRAHMPCRRSSLGASTRGRTHPPSPCTRSPWHCLGASTPPTPTRSSTSLGRSSSIGKTKGQVACSSFLRVFLLSTQPAARCLEYCRLFISIQFSSHCGVLQRRLCYCVSELGHLKIKSYNDPNMALKV
mmetsp:Transcript_68893/g.118267  ORF Transcript_68893/g.118267 Transcript_68893/m.118267 type:complete len:218 (+) Transcript_68893:90-743(+)